MAHAARPFHLLAKPTGSECNLACEYCFFLDKAALYPDARQRMSDEVLGSYLRQLFGSQPPGAVTVAWQGGEPTLMGIPFFDRAVRLARSHARPDQEAEFTLQTNATLIDDEWAAFLARNRFLVGVSLDGPQDVHDAYRHDRRGRGTHDLVMRGVAALDSHGAEWNALTAVHHASEGRGRDVYRFLRDEAGARFVQFIPIVEWETREDGDRERVTHRSVTPDGYGRFMTDVFDEWVGRDVGEVFVQTFDDALAAYVGAPRICMHSPTCGRALALEFNGDVYSCDHFVRPDMLLGNVMDTPLATLVESERQRQFGREKLLSLPPACRACPVLRVCAGGCPKDLHVPAHPDDEARNHLCAGYRRLFSHIDPDLRRMAGLLRRGRAPADVMGSAGA